MNSQSVRLVLLPGTSTRQDRYYQAHIDSNEDVALFQPQWDVHLQAESLRGVTVEEALCQRTCKLLDLAYGHH